MVPFFILFKDINISRLNYMHKKSLFEAVTTNKLIIKLPNNINAILH
jgi:hypothetical protein